MEALIYAKDMRKPVVAIFAERTFRPYGALGAITASATRSIVLKDDSSLAHAASDIAIIAHAQATKKTDTVNITDPLQVTILYYDWQYSDHLYCIYR